MTNNKQQTAVEWLIEQFYNNVGMLTSKKLLKAKEMEKEQHEATALAMIEYVLDNIEGKNNLDGKDAFEKYYNETYGDNNE